MYADVPLGNYSVVRLVNHWTWHIYVSHTVKQKLSWWHCLLHTSDYCMCLCV